jgi:3-oxoacyl-[acyl-carrier protein] reductase
MTYSGAALVTGVGRRAGIGAEICRVLGERGMPICYSFWHRYDQEAPWGTEDDFPFRFADELGAAGIAAHGFDVDLSHPDAPAELMRRANERVGEVSILVNNAAVSEQGDLFAMDGPMLDRHYAVNVRGMAMLTRAFVAQFTGSSGGRIINLTSGQGQGPMPEELAYAMSKGAVEAFTTSLFPTVAARGITVNAVNPGPTDTGWIPDDFRPILLKQFPMGRIGTALDVANLVAFLVSREGGWITGQVINSEGGFWRK